jgi:hypothetical protein
LQAVSGLTFGSGGSVGKHFPQSGAGLVKQLFNRSLAGEVHGREDATTRSQDLQVSPSFQTHLKFGGTVAHPQ